MLPQELSPYKKLPGLYSSVQQLLTPLYRSNCPLPLGLYEVVQLVAMPRLFRKDNTSCGKNDAPRSEWMYDGSPTKGTTGSSTYLQWRMLSLCKEMQMGILNIRQHSQNIPISCICRKRPP